MKVPWKQSRERGDLRKLDKITVRLDPVLADRADLASAKAGVPLSELARRALRALLDAQEVGES